MILTVCTRFFDVFYSSVSDWKWIILMLNDDCTKKIVWMLCISSIPLVSRRDKGATKTAKELSIKGQGMKFIKMQKIFYIMNDFL